MQHEVKDGTRTLKFDGRLLARSSSKRPGADRWVDFELYVTASGTYIVGRTGQSNIFHHIDCEVVERNELVYDPEYVLEDRHVPCEICYPDEDLDDIIIEKPRPYALVSDLPAAVIENLYKKDESGARYMTNVGKRLLEEACEHDKRLEKAYRVETIL